MQFGVSWSASQEVPETPESIKFLQQNSGQKPPPDPALVFLREEKFGRANLNQFND